MSGMTQAEYARHRGVTRQAISHLITAGRIPDSALVSENGRRLIDPAAADFALGETRERVFVGDAREEGPEAFDPTFGSNAGAPQSPQGENIAALTRARTATEIYRARMAELEFDEKVGKLLLADDVKQSMEKIASTIVRELEDIPNFADEILAAGSRDGALGVRNVLKSLVRNVRLGLEQRMEQLANDQSTASA